jgi:hypothetical protein
MSNNGYIPEHCKTGIICIDSYEEKTFEGRLWYPRFNSEQKFNNLMQLVEAVDSAVKATGYPDDYSQLRTFDVQKESASSPGDGDTAFIPENGRLATFRIKIIFLQNATWQGIVTWLERDTVENFRSMRELVYLMDSALTAAN